MLLEQPGSQTGQSHNCHSKITPVSEPLASSIGSIHNTIILWHGSVLSKCTACMKPAGLILQWKALSTLCKLLLSLTWVRLSQQKTIGCNAQNALKACWQFGFWTAIFQLCEVDSFCSRQVTCTHHLLGLCLMSFLTQNLNLDTTAFRWEATGAEQDCHVPAVAGACVSFFCDPCQYEVRQAARWFAFSFSFALE